MADLTALYRTILNSEYQRRVNRNPAYSKTAFSRSLGIDRTYLAKLTSGKILLSLDIADQITKKLNLTIEQRKEFLVSVAEEHSCHALYRVDSTLTQCDPSADKINNQPCPRRKNRR